MFSPKYLSPASIKELKKNPSAPKRVYFVNSIVILSKDSDTEEDTSSTNAHEHELDDMERRSEGIKEHGKEDDEIETDMEVEEVIEEEESEFETDEEVKEVFEEDEDDESFNSFPTMKELIPVALSISTMEKWSSENPSKKKQALPTMKKKEWSCLARYFSFGRHLDELHVTWAHLEKKRARLRTNTKPLEDLRSQSLETASQAIHDAVIPHQVTTSHNFMTVSTHTDSNADLEDSSYDGVTTKT
ncbi:hypothetical protein Tco_1514608 [Tanacetum coccineum]